MSCTLSFSNKQLTRNKDRIQKTTTEQLNYFTGHIDMDRRGWMESTGEGEGPDGLHPGSCVLPGTVSQDSNGG